jgi:monoamine oxidase
MVSASALLSACTEDVKPVIDKDKQVVVIGAGVAGLSAARRLHDAGLGVLLLEGRERIGGRVWTSHAWADTPLDMGASWIHGIDGNPITALAKEIKAQTAATDYENAWLYDVDGALLGDAEWEEVQGYGADVVLAAVKAKLCLLGDDYSLQEAIENTLDLDSLSRQERQRLNFYLNTNIEHEYAADVAELSAKHFDEGDEFDGGDVIFPDGYDQIVNKLAAGLEIKLGHVVEKIAYDEQQVTIVTNQGSFAADYAVITLPLGVLQSGRVTFEPPLPASKQEAINSLGFGVLNKLYLRFPTAFWPKEADVLNHISENKGEWAEWLNIYHYIDAPILLGFNAAEYGRAIEALSDEEIVAAAMTVLRKLYGDRIPEPEAWQLSRWASDPFAFGSYSFNAVGSSGETREQLAQPVNERLFFAGEATSEEYAATVHGAYLSGQREAERILMTIELSMVNSMVKRAWKTRGVSKTSCVWPTS